MYYSTRVVLQGIAGKNASIRFTELHNDLLEAKGLVCLTHSVLQYNLVVQTSIPHCTFACQAVAQMPILHQR